MAATDYNGFVARIYELQASDATDTDLTSQVPNIIGDAELACLRDLDPVYARKYDQALTVTGGTALVSLPADCWIIRKLTLMTGTVRSELTPRQKSYLDEFWSDQTVTGTPKHYATPVEGSILVAPTPAGGTVITCDYTFRPATLSATNPTTWLSTNYPDLLFFAAAVWIAGFTKAYGGEDPQGPGFWQSRYTYALAAARNEEARKKGEPMQEQGPTPPISTIGG